MVEGRRPGFRATALRSFVRKEVRHLLRDRQTLVILLLLPLAQVIVFGFAVRTDVNDVRIAFVDPVPDVATRAIRNRFAGNGQFVEVAAPTSAGGLESLFRRGGVDAALVFEPGLADRLGRGEAGRLLLVTDASDPNTASRIEAYAGAVLGAFRASLPGSPPVRLEVRGRMRYNPTLESVNLFVPGLIALVLTLVSSLMSAISLSREKERGTLEVLLVSPIRPWQIIVGKVLPYLALAFANVATALVAARLVFGVPLRGSISFLLAASLLYSLVGLALGVLIAARAPSQRAAMLGALVGTMMPSTLLSGMIFPIASLPGWLQPVTAIIPARWFIVIVRGIMLRGVGMAQLWHEMAVLAGMLALLMFLAIRGFGARLEEA